MFLAIINDTYCEVKAELALQKNAYDITDYFKRGFNNVKTRFIKITIKRVIIDFNYLLRFGGTRDRLNDIEIALKLASEDGKITYEEIRQHLKRLPIAGFHLDG